MNLAKVLRAGFRMVPGSVRGPVVFVDADGHRATGEAIGVPARGSASDGFAERQMVRERSRVLSVTPTGLAFPPQAGMLVEWEGLEWRVLSGPPLNPSGRAVAHYRVVISR